MPYFDTMAFFKDDLFLRTLTGLELWRSLAARPATASAAQGLQARKKTSDLGGHRKQLQ